MCKFKKIFLTLLVVSPLAFTCVRGQSLSTTVNFNSGTFTMTDFSSSVLSGGSTADGNGDVLELGYFSTATTGSVFSGTFVALSGQNSANNATIPGSSPSETFNQTSIGDLNSNGAGNGTFALSLTFVQGNLNSGNNLPTNGTPLAIMFYNSTTIGASTQSNAVSDASWLWKNPGFPPSSVNISLNDSGLQWLGGPSSAFKTVPEPSTYAFLGFGLLLLLRRLRRRLLTH